jgi:hypothetical protein
VNFNIGNFKTDIPSRFAAINTIIHELMHVLGFSSILYDKFIDSEGVIIPLDKVINEAKTLDG